MPELLKIMQEKDNLKKDIFAVFLLFLIPFLLYFPSYSFDFLHLWDDGLFILRNPRMDFTFSNIFYYFSNPFQDLYTPLTMYSLMADKLFFGTTPLPFRLHNLLLHFISSLFFFLTLRKYFKVPLPAAFFPVLLWTIHPQKLESVIWITERKDVLSGALFFASFYFFCGNMQKKTLPILSTILALLAIMAKPSAIPLPGVMLVTYIAFYGRKAWSKNGAKLLLLPILSTISLVIYSAFVTAKTNPGVMERNFLIPLHNLFWYPLRSIFPTTHVFYPPIYRMDQLYGILFPGLAVALLLLSGMIFFRWQKRKIAASFLIICGLMVPVLGLLHYTNYHYCDRYNYLVSAGIWATIALLAKSALRKEEKVRVLLWLLFSFAAIIYAVQTLFLIPHWKDSKTLFSIALGDNRPSNQQLYSNGALAAILSNDAGMMLKIAEKMEKDHLFYGKDSEKIRIRSKTYFLHGYIMESNYPKAVPLYKELDRMIKNGADLMLPMEYAKIFFRNMGMTAAAIGNKENALFYLEKYFALQKTPSQIYYMTLALKAQLKEDLSLLEEALSNLVRLVPENPQYKKALENIRQQKKRSVFSRQPR